MYRSDPDVRVYIQRKFNGMDYEVFFGKQVGGNTFLLNSEGDWIEYEEGAYSGVSAFTIPYRLMGSFIEGFEEFIKDKVPDPGTESKVLREMLLKEQERVDKVLKKVHDA